MKKGASRFNWFVIAVLIVILVCIWIPSNFWKGIFSSTTGNVIVENNNFLSITGNAVAVENSSIKSCFVSGIGDDGGEYALLQNSFNGEYAWHHSNGTQYDVFWSYVMNAYVIGKIENGSEYGAWWIKLDSLPNPNGEYRASWGDGNPHANVSCPAYGTASIPLIIHNCNELQNMKNNLGASYALANDVDCNETKNWNSGAGFEPIGIFTGGLNGQGHKIKNLYINRPNENYIGLFSVISPVGTVKNIRLEDAQVNGHAYTGILAGQNKGYIESSYTKGYVITTANSNDRLGNTYDCIGGFVGSNYNAHIKDSYASVFVNSTTSGTTGVGGFIGCNYADNFDLNFNVTNSYSVSNVNGAYYVGGFIGHNTRGNVIDCFSSSHVKKISRGGSFITIWRYGRIYNSYCNRYPDSPECFSDPGSYGQFIGAQEIPNNEDYFKDNSNPPMARWDFTNIWRIDYTVNDGFPSFALNAVESNTFSIGNCIQLQNIRNNLTADYALIKDIDCSATRTWNSGAGFEPIGIFTGGLNGQGHKIKNLYINRPNENYIGLFNKSFGIIKYLGLENANISCRSYCGTIAAWNNNIMKRVYATGSVYSSDSYAAAGGLVGHNAGEIRDSYAKVSVKAIGDNVGGLVGVNTAIIENCFSLGDVSGANYAGGLVGRSSNYFENDYYNYRPGSNPPVCSYSYVSPPFERSCNKINDDESYFNKNNEPMKSWYDEYVCGNGIVEWNDQGYHEDCDMGAEPDWGYCNRNCTMNCFGDSCDCKPENGCYDDNPSTEDIQFADRKLTANAGICSVDKTEQNVYCELSFKLKIKKELGTPNFRAFINILSSYPGEGETLGWKNLDLRRTSGDDTNYNYYSFYDMYPARIILTKDTSSLRCHAGIQGTQDFILDSAWLNDLDKDGYRTLNQLKGIVNDSEIPLIPKDCDDWICDDNNPGFLCPVNLTNLEEHCSIDSDNDGKGDYAKCSYCRNPGLSEKVDDIDNDCSGHCQANPSITCVADSFSGDGANSADCAGQKNEFDVVDEFCQMVDDNVQTDDGVCVGYNRAVKWGERLYNKEDIAISLVGNVDHYKKKTYYSFIPGGANGNADCSIKIVIEPVETRTLEGMNAFEPLIVNYPDNFFKEYIVEKQVENEYGLNFIPVLVKRETYPGCLASAEDIGLTRGTTGLPEQFIDSFRGELNFSKFGLSSSILLEKDGEGNFKWQWHSACVAKDKCDDSADNNGRENLLDVEPYGLYMAKIEEIEDEKGNKKEINSSLLVNLVDVDDPECKFNNPQKVNDTSNVKIYSSVEHKINPVKNLPYCLDDDGDGFCGCKTKLVLGPGGTPDVVCDTDNKNYSISKQFPDCDDDPIGDDNQYVIGQAQNRLLTSPALGWGENLSDELAGQPFSAWHVHPFAPVNKFTCTLGEFDFNCNKNGLEGNNLQLLSWGDTPFDFYLNTGMENLAYGTDSAWYEQILKDENRDAVCYEYPSYRDATIQAGMMAGMIAVSFIPGLNVIMNLKTVQALLTIQDAATMGDCVGYAGKVDKLCVWTKISSMGLSLFTFGVQHVASHKPTETSSRFYKVVYNGATKQITLKSSKPVPRNLAAPDDVGVVTTPKQGCFLENTSVMLENGSYIAIQNLKEGDRIMGFDLENNKAVGADVTAFFIRNETRYRIIEYEAVE
jgi:hypothetical protein